MTDEKPGFVIPGIPNFQLRILAMPEKFIRLVDYRELLAYVGPKWPLYVYEKKDDPNRPGDVSAIWIFAQDSNQIIGAVYASEAK